MTTKSHTAGAQKAQASPPFATVHFTCINPKGAKADTTAIFDQTLAGLERKIRNTSAAKKADLPWIKLARIGHVRSEAGCIRHDANILASTGCEIDYDGDRHPEGTRIPFLTAVVYLKRAGIEALVYETPSTTPSEPHWRALCPFSQEYDPKERARFVARLNGLFGGSLDPASFRKSQAFYYGNVIGKPKVAVVIVEGQRIDLAGQLDAGAVYAIDKPPGDDDDYEPSAPGEWSIEKLREMVAAIDPDIDYNDWIKVGFGIHYETGGSEEGFELFDTWSQGGGKYEKKTTTKQIWKDAKKKCDHPATGWSILEFARSATPPWKGVAPQPSAEEIFPDEISEDDKRAFAAHNAKKPAVTMTEADLADVFAEKHKNDLRYCMAKGQWYVWSEHFWKPDNDGEASYLAAQVCRQGIKATEKGAKVKERSRLHSGVMKFAKDDRIFAIEPTHFDRDSMLLGTPAGTVDLRTGKLRDGAPSDLISKQTAVAPGGDCPRWLQFLDEATGGDAELIRFLKQWFGYCLTGETREHAIFFVHGEGGNGKGILINTIGDLLNDYCLDVEADVLSERKFEPHTTEIARLAGARMVRTSETKLGTHWNQQRLTKWTGGDPLTGRFMRCDDVTFLPQFKLNIMGNHKPQLHEVNDAIKRRFNVIPFTKKPAVDDKKLREKLKTEWPGILAWMIEGCLDWQEHGLVKPEIVLKYTAAYLDEQDTPTQWVAECLDKKKGYEDTYANLYPSWARYAQSEGEEPGNSKAFKAMMLKQGFPPKEIGRAKAAGYSGARLKPEEADHAGFNSVEEDTSGLI